MSGIALTLIGCGCLLAALAGPVAPAGLEIAAGLIALALLPATRPARTFLAEAGRGVAPLVPLLVLAPLSAVWSVEPGVTLERSAWLIGSTVVGVCLGRAYSSLEQARLVALTLTAVAVASAVVVLVWPEHGVMDGNHSGAWSGVFHNRNTLGRVTALSTVACAVLLQRHPPATGKPMEPSPRTQSVRNSTSFENRAGTPCYPLKGRFVAAPGRLALSRKNEKGRSTR